MARLRSQLNAFPVQTINLENIVCAKLVSSSSSNSPAMVLIHGKVKPTMAAVDVMIRSSHRDFSNALAAVLPAVLR